jgi:hypothetical protein
LYLMVARKLLLRSRPTHTSTLSKYALPQVIDLQGLIHSYFPDKNKRIKISSLHTLSKNIGGMYTPEKRISGETYRFD